MKVNTVVSKSVPAGLLINTRRVCVKVLPVCILLPLHMAQMVATEGVAELETHLRNATTYYWLGIADKEDPRAFDQGLRSIRKADARLAVD